MKSKIEGIDPGIYTRGGSHLFIQFRFLRASRGLRLTMDKTSLAPSIIGELNHPPDQKKSCPACQRTIRDGGQERRPLDRGQPAGLGCVASLQL